MRKRRGLATWFLWVTLLVGASGWLGPLSLWAQEGALKSSAEEEVAEQRERATGLSQPPGEPVVIYEGEPGPPEEQGSTRWGNMNWFALYLVLAGPVTFFVFRGVSR